MADYIAKVNPRYFAAVRDVRVYLNGISIEPHPAGGAIIVGSNGATLAAIHDPEGYVREPIIVGGITRSLLSACKVKGNPLTFTRPQQLLIGKTCAVVTGHTDREPEPDPFDPLTLHAERIDLIDASYPNWRRIMPVDRKDELCRFPVLNANYLARLSDAYRILTVDD